MNKYLEEALEILEQEKISRWKTKFKVYKKLRKIEDAELIREVGMAEMPKLIFLIQRKKLYPIRLKYTANDIVLRIGRLDVANMSYLAVFLHFMKVEKNVLTLEGHISIPSALAGMNEFYLRHNEKKIPVQMSDRGMDLKIGENTYETRTVFKADIVLDETTNSIQFCNCLNGRECSYGKINSMRFMPVADIYPEQYCTSGKWLFYIEKNQLICKTYTKDEAEKKEKQFQKCIEQNTTKELGSWIKQLRDKSHKCLENKKKPIWMFMDRTDRADDNAEALFEYVQKDRDIDSYFVIEESSKDYERLSKIGKTVPLYSEEHFLLALTADYILSSQCNGVVENPFWEKAEYFRDLYHNPKLIFLQHGVIKDDMSPTLNRFHTNFTGFITSTEAEYQSILQYPYDYTEQEVWLTGLPIFDKLYDNPQKIILIMPTWRKHLMHQEWNESQNKMDWVLNDGFENSIYFKRYDSLLHNRQLQAFCCKNGYRLAFMPHPIIEPYAKYFLRDGDDIFLWDASKSYLDAFAEGNLMITDYSSVAFEFAYLNKPVLYYQFDSEEFFATHTYRKGYFDYEKDGFGEVVTEEKALVDIITSGAFKEIDSKSFCNRKDTRMQILQKCKNL